MAVRTQVNTDFAQTLSGKTLTAPVLNSGTCGADPVVNLGVATKQWVEAQILAAKAPSGSIIAFGGASAPTGWLMCDGTAVSRATYAGLFAVLGTAYGVGDGANTFNLPDFRGRFPLGIDGSANRVTSASVGGANADTRGGAGGEQIHILTITEMPAHTHPTGTTHNFANSSGQPVKSDPSYDATGTTPDKATGITNNVASQGGNGAHNTMPPWQTVNYIVRT